MKPLYLRVLSKNSSNPPAEQEILSPCDNIPGFELINFDDHPKGGVSIHVVYGKNQLGNVIAQLENAGFICVL